MAIEYLINRPCPVKDRLTVDGLITMLKLRSSVEMIIEAERRDGKSEQELRDVLVSRDIISPKGVTTQGESSIGEILDQTDVLSQLKGACRECPAALGGPFGCHGAINYPVSGASEDWLMALAARSTQQKNLGNMVIKFIMEEKFNGEPFNRLRKDPTFFELPKAPEMAVAKGMFGKKTVSSDQLLQFLLPQNGLEGSIMQAIAFFSGGLAVQDAQPQEGTADMAVSVKDPQGREKWLVYDMPATPQDDRSILQWKKYFKAVFRAFATKTDILLHY